MKNLQLGSFLLSGLSCTAAYANQPSDTVMSDGVGNTAMGTSALLDLVTPTSCATQSPFGACWNTAELAPMLLKEVQTQQATIAYQVGEIRDLKQQQQTRLAAQDAEIRDLKNLVVEMRAGMEKLGATTDARVAAARPPRP